MINPLDYSNWNDLLVPREAYSFFHSSNWAKVLQETYKYTPLYFTLVDSKGLGALLPFMEVNSALTGKRGVSLPFSDYCEPVVSSKMLFGEILDRVIDCGKRRNWKHLELKGGRFFLEKEKPSALYFTHTLSLYRDPAGIFSNFRGSTKRNIRRAQKEGVEVQITDTLDSIKEFYRLHCVTRKKHGLPVQPFRFFRNIHTYIITKGFGSVALAWHRGACVASTIFFQFGEKVDYKYNAWEPEYRHLRANNLIIWEAIKWYINCGFTDLSFGRTDLLDMGLRQFKRGWGTTEHELKYYRYEIGQRAFVGDSFVLEKKYSKLLRLVPIPFLRLTGSLLYRHFG